LRAVDLYCLQCEKVLKVRHHLVFKPWKKIEFLQKHPRMMGMFLGNVIFLPDDDAVCRVESHLMVARQSEHVVDPQKDPNAITVSCRVCGEKYRSTVALFDVFGNICQACLDGGHEE